MKWWQNSKTQNVTIIKLWQNLNSDCDKLKKSNCDETQKLKLCQKLKLWWNLTTQIGMKQKTQMLTKLTNSNCDKTQKLKLWVKTQNVKRKKLENSKCDNSNCDKLKNSNYDKTKKNSNCDKAQKLKLWQIMKKKTLKGPFSKNIRWDVLWAAFWDFSNVYI